MGPQKILVARIHDMIRGYRAHDSSAPKITKTGISSWIKQFEKPARRIILQELVNIFRKRYYSRGRIRTFLFRAISDLARKYGYKSPRQFLLNVNFIQTQERGRSQADLLDLIRKGMKSRLNIGLEECGSRSHKYSLYLDDMLCTGLTFFNCMKSWSGLGFRNERINNALALEAGKTKLVLVFIFCHQKNYQKKLWELRQKVFDEDTFRPQLYCAVHVRNDNILSPNQLIKPNKKILTPRILKYIKSINNTVDDYTAEKTFKGHPDFFRRDNYPKKERFFSCAENRDFIEKQFLVEGIKIVNRAKNMTENIRALGYSLPSTRDFGFGALCFTYRNISNNSPLVFWYSMTGFRRLFSKRE